MSDAQIPAMQFIEGAMPRPTNTVADISDAELLRRAVRSCRSPRNKRKVWIWTLVRDRFCLGSTYAHQLCRRFDIDPDERV